MRIKYYKDTDSLYIDFLESSSTESREDSDGIVLDYDADGRLVGIDIDQAASRVELERLIVSDLPGAVESG